MLKHAVLFGSFIFALWILSVLVVYLISATGNGVFLELAFTAIFIGVPIVAGVFLASFHNSKIGGSVSWKYVGLIWILTTPILIIVSGFLSPLLGRAMLGFGDLPSSAIFSLNPESAVKVLVACVVGLLFFHRRVNINQKQ